MYDRRTPAAVLQRVKAAARIVVRPLNERRDLCTSSFRGT